MQNWKQVYKHGKGKRIQKILIVFWFFLKVFQRRVDGAVDFYRTWAEYKAGFGDVEHEFWLGNDNLHRLTSQKNFTLRVDLEDWDGSTVYAEYSDFSIESEQNDYRLTVGGYNGTAGKHHIWRPKKNTASETRNSTRGGGALPYWRWRGRAAGQGMIFAVITISTGYLNQPKSASPLEQGI